MTLDMVLRYSTVDSVNLFLKILKIGLDLTKSPMVRISLRGIKNIMRGNELGSISKGS